MRAAKRLSLLLLLPALLLPSSCASAKEEHAVTFFAMDTVMGISVFGPHGQEAAQAAQTEIRSLEKLLSVTDADSEIFAANRSGGAAVEVSEQTAELLSRALELCESTDGALDVTVYPVVKAWGFTTGEHRVPMEEELSALLERVDYTRVSLDGQMLSVPAGTELDLGAVAKGYAGDRAAALLSAQGVTSAKLELGGNIHVLGAKPDGSPWRVAVRNPEGEGYAGVVEVTDRAVVTSGGYERYFEADGVIYWHIIDPHTAQPARSGLRSVTIVARSGLLADALSTALFVMGADEAAACWRSRQDFDFILLKDDGTAVVTEGLADSFTLSGDWAGRPLEIVRVS